MEVQHALTPPETTMEVVPFAVEDTLPKMLEAQSTTLMIRNVLGELTSEEILEVLGNVEEEEGSSSTSGKEDKECVRNINVA